MFFAILDVSPRANAAYIPTTTRTVMGTESVNLDLSSTEWEAGSNQSAEAWKNAQQFRHLLPPAFHRSPSNGSTTSTNTNSANDYPSSGMTIVADVPPIVRVQYLRESPTRLTLSKFIDSILDPPRCI